MLFLTCWAMLEELAWRPGHVFKCWIFWHRVMYRRFFVSKSVPQSADPISSSLLPVSALSTASNPSPPTNRFPFFKWTHHIFIGCFVCISEPMLLSSFRRFSGSRFDWFSSWRLLSNPGFLPWLVDLAHYMALFSHIRTLAFDSHFVCLECPFSRKHWDGCGSFLTSAFCSWSLCPG